MERFKESNDILQNPSALRRRINDKGYLVFFRDLIPSDDVLTLRRKILEICKEAGDPTLRLLTTDFRSDDVLFFKSLTVHGACENHTQDRLRLSIDFRYTGISHTISESWLHPHYHWLGEAFSWDNLDKDWTDESLKRYWEKGPKIKSIPRGENPK